MQCVQLGMACNDYYIVRSCFPRYNDNNNGKNQILEQFQISCMLTANNIPFIILFLHLNKSDTFRVIVDYFTLKIIARLYRLTTQLKKKDTFAFPRIQNTIFKRSLLNWKLSCLHPRVSFAVSVRTSKLRRGEFQLFSFYFKCKTIKNINEKSGKGRPGECAVVRREKSFFSAAGLDGKSHKLIMRRLLNEKRERFFPDNTYRWTATLLSTDECLPSTEIR